MADHHLPPEPVATVADHHHHNKAVHADDLVKPSHRRRSRYYRAPADPFRVLCSAVLLIILVAGVTALVLYLVYRPTRPAFAVTSVAVYSLARSNATAAAAGDPTAVAAAFQFTFVIRNPNDHSAARYDRLTAYVAYRGEAITAPAPMPPLVQDANSAVAVAPVLGGAGTGPVPVSPDAASALANDVSYGVVALRVVVLGRVRFVSGPFRSGWHTMYARCDLLVGVRKGAGGGSGTPEAPLLGNPACDVDM